MSGDEIRVIVDEETRPREDTSRLQARPSFEEAVRRTFESSVSMTVTGMRDQLASMYEKVTAAIEALPKESHGCSLQAVSFTLAISSSGEVSLLSAIKGKLEGQTGFTFTIQKVS
jgi:hypothetical protein